MMEGKMHGKGMEEAKMHYDALMGCLDRMGMSMGEFEDQMEGEKPGEEEGGDYQEPADEGEDMGKKPMMDKGKIALIVAKMKNRMKGE